MITARSMADPVKVLKRDADAHEGCGAQTLQVSLIDKG